MLSVCLLIFVSHFSSFTPKKYNVYYLHIADIVMPPNPRYSVETMHCVHIWLLLYWFLNAYVGIKENHNIIEWFRCFTYWFKYRLMTRNTLRRQTLVSFCMFLRILVKSSVFIPFMKSFLYHLLNRMQQNTNINTSI